MATFSSTVMLGSSFTCWKVRLKPMRATCREVLPLMRSPLNSTSPLLGESTPDNWLNRVLLPAPLGPIRARISPAWMSRLMSLLATKPPKRLVTLRAWRMTWPCSGSCRRGRVRVLAVVGLRLALRALNNPVRIGHKPPGARCMSTTMRMPNTMVS
ncbi:hypothetical protein D3C80_1523410 [compost metagenome]